MRRRRIILTGGLVAIAVGSTASAIKMKQADAQRIEAHTGKKPEDLTEEQLEAAIDELDIETQELTDADVAAIEAVAVSYTHLKSGIAPMLACSSQPASVTAMTLGMLL